VVSPQGRLIRSIPLPYRYVTNMQFRGDNERIFYVTVETDADNPQWIYQGKLYQIKMTDFSLAP
jgi:sugar lactone lactonase YvrE